MINLRDYENIKIGLLSRFRHSFSANFRPEIKKHFNQFGHGEDKCPPPIFNKALKILLVFPHLSSCGLVDLRIRRVRSCVRIPRTNCFFYFQLENILRSNLNFSTSYGRSTDLKFILRLLLVSFIWLGEKISLKYLSDWFLKQPLEQVCR